MEGFLKRSGVITETLQTKIALDGCCPSFRHTDSVLQMRGHDVTFFGQCVTAEHISSIDGVLKMTFINCVFDPDVVISGVDLVVFTACKNFPKFDDCGTARVDLYGPAVLKLEKAGIEKIVLMNKAKRRIVAVIFGERHLLANGVNITIGE